MNSSGWAEVARKDQRADAMSQVIIGNRTHQRPAQRGFLCGYTIGRPVPTAGEEALAQGGPDLRTDHASKGLRAVPRLPTCRDPRGRPISGFRPMNRLGRQDVVLGKTWYDGKRVIYDWQRRCLCPRVQARRPVTRPAESGEEAIPCCWFSRLDFLFLVPHRVRSITRRGRRRFGSPLDRRAATMTRSFRRWPTPLAPRAEL